MKSKILFISACFLLYLIPNSTLAQVPDLAGASSFAVFTGEGSFNNDGPTSITGDIGTNTGAFNGFPPGVVFGEIHIEDAESNAAAMATTAAYATLASTTCGLAIGPTLGNGQTLTPNVYCLGGAGTLNGILILDADNDPDAVFIIQVNGEFSTSTFASVQLVNGASLCNVWWQVNGAFTLGDGTNFLGNVLAHGAITFLSGASLTGRALATVGAVNLHANMVTIGLDAMASAITADGPTTFCEGDSVTLSGNEDGVWNTGEVTPSISVSTTGIYFVINSSDCGIETSNLIEVTVNPLPDCNISGLLSFCDGQSTELCVDPGADSILWSTGENTNCITVNEEGLFEVTVITDGCERFCSALVTVELDGVTEVSCNSGVEVSLDSDGNGSVVLADLIASAEATCGIASMEATQLDFNCDDLGTASVEVTITNTLGDEATCTATVEVVENYPVAECLDITFPIADENMTFYVNAQSIDGGSSATCGDLSFSFDGDTPGFTCDDDGTTHTVTLVVTNDAGLTATCESEITVLCVEGLIEISGYVEREFGDPVGGVEMSWLGTPGGISLSQGDGLYQIFVDPNSNAVVTPQKDGNPTQYLSTIDLITLQRHILQIDPFTSPYRIIAGDATFDDVVSTFDLVVLQSLIIGIIDDLNGPIWRFIPASYTFDNPTNPFGEDFPEVKGYQGVVNAQTGEDWVAIKTGDVAWTSGTRLANQSVQFNVHAVEDNAGEQYLVFTSANDTELKGYQMALSFDRNISVAEFIPSAELLGMSDLNFHMEDDFARTNYYNGEGIAVSAGMELFRLRVNYSSDINNPLSVVEIYNQDRMRAEAYPTNSEMSGITLGTSVETDDIWSVFKLSPVPAITDLMLELNTSDDMTVEFEIYNSNGQLMRSFDQNLYNGMNSVNLDIRDFAAGSYFIRIVGSDKSETIPFIKMD